MDKPITHKPWKKKALLLGIALLLLAGGGWQLYSVQRVNSLRVEAASLKTATVSLGVFHEYLLLDATVEPLSSIWLDAPQTGRVEALLVEDGAEVRAGDALIRLTSPDQELQLLEREEQVYDTRRQLAQTAHDRVRAASLLKLEILDTQFQLEQARQTYRQDSLLALRQFVSATALQQSADKLRYLRQKLELLSAKLETENEAGEQMHVQLRQGLKLKDHNLAIARQRYDRMTVRAPMAGRVSGLAAELGQTKQQGERLGRLDGLRGFKLRALVDEFYVQDLRPGLQGLVSCGQDTAWVELRRVLPQVANGKFVVELYFLQDPGKTLKLGQTLSVRLALGAGVQAVLCPKGAWLASTGGHWAFVLGTDGRSAHKKPLKPGKQNPEYVEVLGGLAPGERILISSYEGFTAFDQLDIVR